MISGCPRPCIPDPLVGTTVVEEADMAVEVVVMEAEVMEVTGDMVEVTF